MVNSKQFEQRLKFTPTQNLMQNILQEIFSQEILPKETLKIPALEGEKRRDLNCQ